MGKTGKGTLSGTLAIYDTAGNPLDSDANGISGGDFIHEFTIDRSANNAPVADPQTVTVNEDGSVRFTLTGSDVGGDTLTFGLLTNPAHGVISDFNPATHQVTYTQNPDYWGTDDSFRFQVDEGKLGVGVGSQLDDVLKKAVDILKLQNVITKVDTGFAAYPTVNPVIVADVSGDGKLSAVDVARLQTVSNGGNDPAIPAIPAGMLAHPTNVPVPKVWVAVDSTVRGGG